MANSKRGRPPGSQNVKYAETREIPAACIRCGSTELKKVPGSRPLLQEYGGELPGGFRYRAIIRERRRCECGQMLIVRVYVPAVEEPAEK